jgi:hypothetical protein
MSQRVSGYARQQGDAYQTPEWCVRVLSLHLPIKSGSRVWEPACGEGKIVAVLKHAGYQVVGTDIINRANFFTAEMPRLDAVISNPPYSSATEFIEHALQVSQRVVAMLLRTDFDHAKTRAHLFAAHRAFAKKIALTQRIVWFDKPGAAPSYNHSWFVWDWQQSGPPVLAYGAPEGPSFFREEGRDRPDGQQVVRRV